MKTSSPLHLSSVWRPAGLTALLCSLCLPLQAQLTIMDNFNSGNDAAWSHYAPLQTTPWNEQVSWTFPSDPGGGFAYHLFGGVPPISHDPASGQQTGPARLGSFRNDSTYTDFSAAVDLFSFNDKIPRNTPFLAFHVTTPGFLTTFGFFAGYMHNSDFADQDKRDQQAQFAFIFFQSELTVSGMNDATGGSALVSRLNQARKYRMVATGSGTNYTAAIYERTDLLEPIAKIAGVTNSQPSGTSGVGIANFSTDDDEIADATFDNYYSSPRPSDPVGFPGTPQVINLKPAPQALFYQPPNNGSNITFNIATFSTNQINTNTFSMSLNNTSVTSQLLLTEVRDPLIGTHNTNFFVRYTGALAPNAIYNGQITVLDTSGKGTTNNFVFDTFTTSGAVIVEAEDYNYAGQFQDHPPVSGTEPDGTQTNGGGTGYFGLSGVSNIDYFTTEPSPFGTDNTYHQYRPDGVNTAQNIYAGDTARPDHIAANVPDYYVWRMRAGDWLNYTRTFPAGNWNVYLRASSQDAQVVRFDQVTTDASQDDSAQTKALMGNFLVPNTGSSSRFRYVPLTDAVGNPMVLSFNTTASSPTNTFRFTPLGGFYARRNGSEGHDHDDNGSLQPTYFLFLPATNAAPTRPWIALATPGAGTTHAPVQPTITALIRNRSTSVSLGSIQLRFDGNNVTGGATISNGTPEGAGAMVTYSPPGFLMPNSTHNVSLVFSDGSVTQSNQWSFTVTNLPVIPASYAVSGSASSNFSVQVAKAPNGPYAAPDGHDFQNDTWRAERQLANQIIQPSTMQPYTNQAANTPTNYGFYTEPVAINYDACGNNAGFFNGDVPYPGIPTNYGPDANGDSWTCPATPVNFALAATIRVPLAAGLYRMGVRSDDGFKVTVATNFPAWTNSPQTEIGLGIFDMGRGNDETAFDFLVVTNGLYAFRLVYEQGGGGADCEWYWINRTTGARELVRPLFLESAATVNGPWQSEPAAQFDPGARVITLATSGNQRFYRLRSTRAYQLSSPTVSGNNVVMSYQ